MPSQTMPSRYHTHICGRTASLLLALVVAFAPQATAAVPLSARIKPLNDPVLVGRPVSFQHEGSLGKIKALTWNFGDGVQAKGRKTTHTYAKPGTYKVTLTVTDGTQNHSSFALVRAHTPKTLGIPQIVLDTDAKNEVDDQHYIGYGLFSELDILGINSIHHGGGQESTNYAEIDHVIKLARNSGLPKRRVPMTFHGADQPLTPPSSGKWDDTRPIRSDASAAILAAARGASPKYPVWILPVGPCTNIASAILQARDEGLDLKPRIRVCWLGGGPTHAAKETFNGGNDPWSVYVMGQSGIEFWILLENPTGASLTIANRSESRLYPKNELGKYLVKITPVFNEKAYPSKSLYDLTTISTVLSDYLKKDWVVKVEPSRVLGPDHDYAWKKVDGPSSVHIIRDINEKAMKKDFFDTLNGRPTKLLR